MPYETQEDIVKKIQNLKEQKTEIEGKIKLLSTKLEAFL